MDMFVIVNEEVNVKISEFKKDNDLPKLRNFFR